MKRKIFYGTNGWIVGLQDYEPFKLDQNDDIEYISISQECFDFLQSHMPSFTCWHFENNKLELKIIDEEYLKQFKDLYDHTCELCKQFTSQLYFHNLLNT